MTEHASEWLVDIEAKDSDGQIVMVRLGTCGYVTGPNDDPENVVYFDAIVDPGDYEEHLFSPGRTMGASSISSGAIRIANASREFDNLLTDLDLSGCPYTMWRIDGKRAAWSTAERVGSGFIDRVDSASGFVGLDLVLRDAMIALEEPLQTNRYAGTTTSAGATVEGNEDLKDAVKPLVFGKYFNVEGVIANAYDRIFQFSDGAIESIDVRDGGVALVEADDYDDVATLQAALTTGTDIVPGEAASILSMGLVGIRSASRAITADVTEQSPAYAGSVATAILTKGGIVSGRIDSDSFDDLDTAAPFELGEHVDDDRSISQSLTGVLQSVSAWIKPDEFGVFHVGRFTGPADTAVATIRESDVLTDGGQDTPRFVDYPDTDGHPVYKVILTYKPIGLVQDDSALHDCVSIADKALYGQETRQVVREDLDVKARDPYAIELTIDTTLTTVADVEEEAERILDLYKVRRRLLVMSIRREDATFSLGDTVDIILPGLGLSTGKKMVAMGRRDMRRSERIEYQFWG